MSDRLAAELRAAVEEERPARGPDLAWVVARARRLRLLRAVAIAVTTSVVAGLAATAAVSLPDDPAPDVVTGDVSPPPYTPPPPRPARTGEVVEVVPERQRAEIFAVRALAATGLMRPFNERSYNFTYEDDTTQTDAGWRIGFSSADCAPNDTGDGLSFGCKGISGEDRAGNGLTDTFVTVSLTGDRWEVAGVEGNMLDHEKERLIGYSLPQRAESSHWEFPATGVWQGADGLYVEMLPLWVGPYPTSASGSACEAEALDDAGERVGEARRFYQEAPERELDRAGWVRGIGGFEPSEGVTQVRVRCRQYTGRGWELASEPKTLGRPGAITAVEAELVWLGQRGFTSPALCRATLADSDGGVVWEGAARVHDLWRPGELKDYPYRTRVRIGTGRDPVDAETVGDFDCESL